MNSPPFDAERPFDDVAGGVAASGAITIALVADSDPLPSGVKSWLGVAAAADDDKAGEPTRAESLIVECCCW